MRAALIQLSSTDQPEENLTPTLAMVEEAAAEGADLILTPEVTNCVSTSRAHQANVLSFEEDDITLLGFREAAARLSVWIQLGSIGVKTDDPDGRFANRSFLIGPDGSIRARYDKIHMFDVQISAEETFRESAGYRPGKRAVVADSDFGAIGMTVCYDVRFPHLYRALAKAGARILTVPAAFSPVSGRAHWHTLLRARAIENGCFVLAAAQCGTHAQQRGKPRQTFGHSLAVSPWGEVLADGGEEIGITYVDLNLGDVDKCRSMIPSLTHDRTFEGP